MKMCPHCNSKIDDGDEKCIVCEERLMSEKSPLSSEASDRPNKEGVWNNYINKQVRRSSTNIFLACMGVFLLLGFLSIKGYYGSLPITRDETQILIIIDSVLGTVVLVLGFFYLSCIKNPTKHPMMKKLSRYGDPVQIAESINSEIYEGTFVKSRSFLWDATLIDTVITRTWFLKPTICGILILNLKEIKWAYVSKKTTRDYTNFKLTGIYNDVFVIIWIGIRERLKIKIKSTGLFEGWVNGLANNDRLDDADLAIAIVKELSERAPWAFFGYNKELDQAFGYRVWYEEVIPNFDSSWETEAQKIIDLVNQRYIMYRGLLNPSE